MQSALNAPHLCNEEAAFAHIEAWLWPDGPVCPHCGTIGEATRLKGKTTRPGLWKCRSKECRKPFTVRMGTIFESSHVPLHIWLQAIYLICSSKKGISTRQIQRMLQCSMKTAWHLTHRIRFAMAGGGEAGSGDGGGARDEKLPTLHFWLAPCCTAGEYHRAGSGCQGPAANQQRASRSSVTIPPASPVHALRPCSRIHPCGRTLA